jgi:hypothetical protein
MWYHPINPAAAGGSGAMSDTTDNYDSPWKEALEHFFPDFLAFFFPDAHGDIDWRQGYQFLDKELKQAARDAELGRRYADVLAQVWRQGGQEAWVLVHVEVQGQPQAEFAERMYVYNYRLYDYHRRQVASLAVLADEQPGWRPGQFSYELWGCQAGLVFPTVKLLNYRQQWSSLEESRNPFATVVMAHLKAQETRHDPAERQAWKLLLTRRLYRLGYDRQRVLDLFRFIDWVLQLPGPQELAFWHEVREIEEEKRMQYVTSVERIGMQQGMQQGLQQGLQQGQQQGQAELVLRLLARRFAAVPAPLAERVRAIPSAQMPALQDIALDAASLDEVAAALDVLLAGDASSRATN